MAYDLILITFSIVYASVFGFDVNVFEFEFWACYRSKRAKNVLRSNVFRQTINSILESYMLISIVLFSMNAQRGGWRPPSNICTIYKICTHESLQDHRLCKAKKMKQKKAYGIIVNNHILKRQIHIIWNTLAHRHAQPNTPTAIVLNKHRIFHFPFENSDDIAKWNVHSTNFIYELFG